MRTQRYRTWRRIWPLARTALFLVLTLALTASALLWKEWLSFTELGEKRATVITPTPDRLAPRKLLLLLANTPASIVAQEALVQQEWDTAYVVLAWAIDIPEKKRVELLQAALSQQPPEASLSLQGSRMLYTSAVLMPHLSDETRLHALLFLLSRWQGPATKQDKEATIRSILAILAASPTLRPAERQDALTALRLAGANTESITFSTYPRRPLAMPVYPIPLAPPPLPGDVLQAMQRRQHLARLLAQNPQASALRRQLAAALQAEHLAREHFFVNALAATPTPQEQTQLAWDHLRWATYRDMIAQRAFALSLVPEWERTRADIHMERIKAWETLVGQADDWMTTQPDIVIADQGGYELWRWVAWSGEMGMYPRYPRKQTWNILQEKQANYFAHPQAPWHPWVKWDNSLKMYILSEPFGNQ